MDDSYEVLHQPFDIATHKKTFTNYLEVVIDDKGVVHYAVPSHQECLINYLMVTRNLTREEVWDLCPKEYYFDVFTWLCKETKCISVWDTVYVGTPNKKQLAKLKSLKLNGLYKGKI